MKTYFLLLVFSLFAAINAFTMEMENDARSADSTEDSLAFLNKDPSELTAQEVCVRVFPLTMTGLVSFATAIYLFILSQDNPGLIIFACLLTGFSGLHFSFCIKDWLIFSKAHHYID